MSHRPRRRLATTLLAAATGATMVSLLTSCGLSDRYDRGPYLRGLEEHCGQVTSHLESEGIKNAHCDKYPRAVIEDAGVTYTFSNYGVQSVETDAVLITISATAFHVKVTAITVMVGGGYDAPKAKYDMKNMSNPSTFYWGDDLDWVQRTIEASISTQEMKTLVEQAERYQKLIKTELDNLQ